MYVCVCVCVFQGGCGEEQTFERAGQPEGAIAHIRAVPKTKRPGHLELDARDTEPRGEKMVFIFYFYYCYYYNTYTHSFFLSLSLPLSLSLYHTQIK